MSSGRFNKLENYRHYIGMDLPYFLKGGTWLSLSIVFSSIGGLFLSALFAGLWNQEEYGKYVFLVSAITFLSSATFPGIIQVLLQASAENKDAVLKRSVGLVFRRSFVGMFILFLGGIYFLLRQNTAIGTAAIICSLFFPLYVTATLNNPFLSGKGKFKELSLQNITNQIAVISSVTAALWFIPKLIPVTVAFMAVTSIVGILFLVRSIRKVSNNRDDPGIISMGKKISFPQLLILSAENFDKFIIPAILGFENNAVYAFALLIPNQLNGFLKSILTLAIPKLAGIKNRELGKQLTVRLIQFEFIMIFISIVLIAALPLLFKYFYPAYYTEATFLSQLFSLTLLLFPVNLISNALVKLRAEKEINLINIVNFTTTVFFLMVLMPLYGLTGAILAKILVKILNAVILVYFFRKLTLEYESSK